MCVCGSGVRMSADVHRSQRRPRRLEWEVESYYWVLGTKLLLSAKAALALVHPAISPASLLTVFAMDFVNVCTVEYISLSFLA